MGHDKNTVILDSLRIEALKEGKESIEVPYPVPLMSTSLQCQAGDLIDFMNYYKELRGREPRGLT